SGLATSANGLFSQIKGKFSSLPLCKPPRFHDAQARPGPAKSPAISTKQVQERSLQKIWPQGQCDGLGEYCTSKSSKRSRERGLLKPEPCPALERGLYEKQMDRRWSCRSQRFAWRRHGSGAFLQSNQMDQERSKPHGQRTARREQRAGKKVVSAIAGGSDSAHQPEGCLRGIQNPQRLRRIAPRQPQSLNQIQLPEVGCDRRETCRGCQIVRGSVE